MVNWCKVLIVLLAGVTITFAQFDDTPSDDSYESSYNENSEEPLNVGEVTASSDEWEGFNYEELGLTQWEFQQAKEDGVTRDKLTHLVEMGIRPSEYLQHPWEKLGVSEKEWLDERSGGFEDADIDRSYRNQSGDQSYAYLSLLLPSLYQWKTDQSMKAIWMDALWVGAMTATIYLAADGSNAWWYGLLFVAGAHIWSFADALFSTQWDNNPDANKFSFGVMPTPEQGVVGFFNMKF